MEKALVIFNPKCGKGFKQKILNYIDSSLKDSFDIVDFYVSLNREDFINKIKNDANNYNSLIYAGGDGTFNLVINALKDVKNPPILGCIPLGTLNDSVKSYGYKKSINKSLKIIKDKNIKEFDVGCVDDHLFSYVCSLGCYSNIPYITSQKAKKAFGKLSYYFRAIPMFFHKKSIICKVFLDNNEPIIVDASFILFLNSKYMAGFKINPNGDVSDSNLDFIFAKKGLFNSLLNYFIFRKNLEIHHFQKAKIEYLGNDHWSIDGEMGTTGSISIQVIPLKFKIYSKK